MQRLGKNRKENVCIMTCTCGEHLWKNASESGEMAVSGEGSRQPGWGGREALSVFPSVPLNSVLCVSNIFSKTLKYLKGSPKAFPNCTASLTLGPDSDSAPW